MPINIYTSEFLKSCKCLSFSIDYDYLSVDTEFGGNCMLSCKKGLHKDAEFQALGLINLVRQEDHEFRFVLPYVCN